MADPISSFSGVSSGLDFRSLVDQIMTLERRPAARMEAAVAANTRRRESLDKYREALTALQTAADALKTGAAFDSFSTTTSGQDASGRSLVGAAATAGASAGSYQVEVLALARAQKTTAGAGQASATAALNLTGGFALERPDGTAVGTINVAAGDSLTAVRDKINALNSGATPSGVQATILSAGPGDQRLVLTASKAGAAAGFTLEDGGAGVLGALGLDAAGATPPLVKAAADASFTVDGVPMTRATNSVGDAIAGVTLTLNAVEPGRTATVAVERVASGGTEAAKAFVEAYNKVVAFVKAQNVAGADGKAPPLRGDPLLRGTQTAMASQLLGAAPGAGAGLATLGSAGISLQRDGTLALDAAKFKDASGARLGELRTLLADRMTAITAPALELTKPSGLLDGRGISLGESSARLTDRVADVDARLEKKRAALIAQYTKFEGAIGRLKSIGDAMSAQFAGLNKSSDR
jgi:flagellar hook-associated protein 2